ncbi:MAG: phosphoribosylformylglycinamidine synthase subunit PurL [Spirochaetales bacterium]|nr:phosphoribosylformylglycinamidine synthase subunit PurL [Spirochaetales bacterium]
MSQTGSGEALFSEKEVTVGDAIEHGLTSAEFDRIQEYLGRIPTVTELGMYSGLWSEHCSYKNSILQLKTLPSDSPRALTKTGEENAGALDIGDGLAVVFKIESHNHPTAVEPYQGAATGVGGIMRDIFTMGARPLVSLNSLRFGPPDRGRNQYLLSRAVKGIGDYGNCLGIAVSGGELRFDESFSRNPLVNAMTAGIVRHDSMAFARAEGAGNAVYIVGASTGRDGIHGASFASQDLSKETEEKRSAVQVGDPFMEKLLLEATLELISRKIITGIQDMGAAGLSCSSSEMSARSGSGMDLNLDLVPLRESGMNAYEIMLSESQERMLVVVKKGKEIELEAIFNKWGLNAVCIGTVRSDGRLRIRHQGRLCVDLPADSLVLGGGAPRYVRETRRPAYLDELSGFNVFTRVKADLDLHGDFLKLIGSLNICSRRPLYEQYDTEVGLVRLQGPGGAAGLSRIPGSSKALATSTDCNSRYVYLDPATGTMHAVAEGARKVACTGARPIGITNNLNFANPYVPENYYMFTEAVRGMREACLALDLPVTGGNVSFYNESDDGPVQPSPVIGTVGLLDEAARCIGPFFCEEGLLIALLGSFQPELGGSEYLYAMHGQQAGRIPVLDLPLEKRLIEFLLETSREGLLQSARSLPAGGLAVGLFRAAYNAWQESVQLFRLETDSLAALKQKAGLLDHPATLWFGESAGCVLLSLRPADRELLQQKAAKFSLDLHYLGVTGPARPLSDLVQSVRAAESVMSVPGELDYVDFRIGVGAAVESFERGLLRIFS